MQALVHGIVTRLAENPAAQLHNWTILMIKDPLVNLYALPSGHIVVFQGMLDVMGRDKDKLAYLLGHEMGHVIGRHGAERVSEADLFNKTQNLIYMLAFATFGDVFTVLGLSLWAEVLRMLGGGSFSSLVRRWACLSVAGGGSEEREREEQRRRRRRRRRQGGGGGRGEEEGRGRRRKRKMRRMEGG